MTISTKDFEGLRLSVYKDSLGVPTIGYGHNLLARNNAIWDLGINPKDLVDGSRKLTLQEADMIFDEDMYYAIEDVKSLVSNYDEHPSEVKLILNDLSFNLGKTKLSKFKNTLRFIVNKDYRSAADALEDSLWYKQVKRRGKIIVEELRKVENI